MVAAVSDRRSPTTGAARQLASGRTGALALYRPAGETLRRTGSAPSATTCRDRRRRTSGRPVSATVYRRRRLLVGGLLLLSVAAVLILAQLIQAGIGGGPLTTTGAAAGPGLVQAGATEYVVQPGDTLWSIAAALAPGRDERPLVDQLAKEVHGTTLYPGEVIPVPASR